VAPNILTRRLKHLTEKGLFERRLEVKQLTLVNPRITLVSDDAGRANWSLAGAESGSPAATAGYRQLLDSLAAAPLRIENGVVRFVDERTGRTISLTGADLMASFAGPASPFAAHGYVMWNRQRVAMTLFVKDPARIPGQGGTLPKRNNTVEDCLVVDSGHPGQF